MPPKTTKPKKGEATPVVSYRHDDKRKNNPHVGMVDTATDNAESKSTWAYDPHIDPTLNFDSAQSQVENLIDEALASGDEKTMRGALEQLKKMQAPYLNWTGKAERTSFEVDLVSLHVHERIDPATILATVQKRLKNQKGSSRIMVQQDLFSAPFENLPLREALAYYKHDRDWANRLIAGDSLLVMNSLLQKESMAGKVQMIYIDPPYGIKYGSNFQPFVNKRDVRDRNEEDLTQEPETIKAFRDTWELGIHSYLTYLRDRLLLAKDLLHESGSVFVQISNENVHHVRELLDEILGVENFCSEIVYRKTAAVSSPDAKVNVLGTVSDILVWYAKKKNKVKYNQLYLEKSLETDTAGVYAWCETTSGQRRRLNFEEKKSGPQIDLKIFRLDNLTSTGFSESLSQGFHRQGKSLGCGPNKHWKTTAEGLQRLAKTNRAIPSGTTAAYIRYINDFPVYPLVNVWLDTGTGSFTDEKIYVVQTGTKALERCLLMTTDPGDLVLDPTCGSGTTSFVAEKWGRRWITCDTSRVAVTLAKQRLMTASYDYYDLKYPHEGLKGGFIYKTVPHVTLKSIANNSQVDEIYERKHPTIATALDALNKAMKGKAVTFKVTDGGRKGETLQFKRGDTFEEWEVPCDFPDDWPDTAKKPFEEFHAARRAMQLEMDRSIADHAEQETLFDQPHVAKNKLRITGPFTVEAVPFATVLGLEEAEKASTPDVAIARSGETHRQTTWRDELLKTGIRGKGGQKLKLADLETLPGTRYLHAIGTVSDTGERVAVSFGPQFAALEQRQVEIAMREAGELFPLPKILVFCAFVFDPEAQKDIDNIKGITALRAEMNPDLLTEDLKKNRASNESFWLMGKPDVDVRKTNDGLCQVEVRGFDYFNTKTNELVSGGKKNIAMWALDTDYDDRSLFPKQVFFPMAGEKDGWQKLKKDIKAELNEDLLNQFHGTVSLPFEAGDNKRIAVKIVDDRGIESLWVGDLD